MYHEPTREVIAGAIPEVKAEAGAIAEVMAGVAVRVILKVILRVDDQGPLVGLNSEGGVTFQEPEVKLDPKGEEENYPLEPSILDVETWLDWQACQLSTPC